MRNQAGFVISAVVFPPYLRIDLRGGMGEKRRHSVLYNSGGNVIECYKNIGGRSKCHIKAAKRIVVKTKLLHCRLRVTRVMRAICVRAVHC